MLEGVNIALLGKARSGKDTLTALLVEAGHHYRRGLADAVKEEIGRALLNQRLNTEYVRSLAYEAMEKWKESDPVVTRKLNQAYGDGKRELVDKQYWIDRIFERIRYMDADSPKLRVVVPDVRYLNECEVFERAGFLTVRILRPGAGLEGEEGQHVSETEADDYVPDFQITNDGTPEEMLQLLKIGHRAMLAAKTMGNVYAYTRGCTFEHYRD